MIRNKRNIDEAFEGDEALSFVFELAMKATGRPMRILAIEREFGFDAHEQRNTAEYSFQHVKGFMVISLDAMVCFPDS